MPFGTYDTPKPPTIPTFLQYVKSCGKGIEGKTKFAIEVIWLPGKFDNVTLQTHAFRYVCDKAHPLYNAIKDYCECIHSDIDCERLEIVIASLEKKQITLLESDKKKGHWEKLGANAFRFKEL